MGVKFAVAMGAEVTVVSSSASKERDARRLGAHHFVLTADEKAMKKHESYFDIVLDAVSGNHDYEIYLKLLPYRASYWWWVYLLRIPK
jgi:uncharacterized zinc-type alcohol dehydrogenase-like protein